MRTRTKGVQLTDDGGRVVNKEYKGERILSRITRPKDRASFFPYERTMTVWFG